MSRTSKKDGNFEILERKTFEATNYPSSGMRSTITDGRTQSEKLNSTSPRTLVMWRELAGTGYFGGRLDMDIGEAPDLGDMGISPTMVSDHLAKFIREVRVLVWWGENEENKPVELAHIINPTGVSVKAVSPA